MDKILLTCFLALSACGLSAQKNVDSERAHIKAMCGCYEVKFRYAETFSDHAEYAYHDRYEANGLEWIFVEEENDSTLVLQHLLIVNDSIVIKHWRQDWHYEHPERLVYQKDSEWEREHLSAKAVAGTWTQKVYQVDDSPRYQGRGEWLEANGQIYWESQVFAPLPRRERTKRNDYNIMLRTNKHKITSWGHLHELDNAKIIRSAAGDSVLVWEKGWNEYRSTSSERCQLAQEWWPEHRAYWAAVRAAWQEVLVNSDYINIAAEKNGQKLWQAIYGLEKVYAAENFRETELKQRLNDLLQEYLTNEPSGWKTAMNP